MTHPYDNAYASDNVYGHAFALLRQFLDAKGVHLDVGCGFGRIAEPLTEQLGLDYVGVDADSESIGSLRDRGFDAHQHVFCDAENDYTFLRKLVGSRTIVSITFLDTLEHIHNKDSILCCLRRVAADSSAYLLLSVPNVAHRDIGFKLAFGRWDYTVSGLLDHTHVLFLTDKTLTALMRRWGWHEIATNDVVYESSDQRFPRDHPALADESTLRKLLVQLRSRVNDSGRTNQFVRLYAPGQEIKESTVLASRGADTERCFLSVVVRTQGRRLGPLSEVFLCLAAQSCLDFEVLVMAHKPTTERLIAIEHIIEFLPRWLRKKTRILKVDHGSRAVPLNVGFSEASGEYIAMLDDDDLVMAHWVETFRNLAQRFPGRVARAAAVTQDSSQISTHHSVNGIRAEGGMSFRFPADFDFLRHLSGNFSPNMTLAFPRSAFHEFQIKFDESLTTTEDWDYFLRVMSVCGVASEAEVVGIYRLWRNIDNSHSVHSQEEWTDNATKIIGKLDSMPILLPTGAASQIRHLLRDLDTARAELTSTQSATAGQIRQLVWDLDTARAGLTSTQSATAGQIRQLECEIRQLVCDRDRAREELKAMQARFSALRQQLSSLKEHVAVLQARIGPQRWSDPHQELRSLLGSTSWRVAAPLRCLGSLLEGPASSYVKIDTLSRPEAAARVVAVRSSTSWKITAPLRALKRLLTHRSAL
jgi:2-polyprenyl-3-methyl-5-hydroxy-6-metoxy-1,4-benzoquinol methylase